MSQIIVVYDEVESWTERDIKALIKDLLCEEFMSKEPTIDNRTTNGDRVIKITVDIKVEEI